MSQNEEDKIDKLIQEVARMNRGLYGDSENKQKGLMQVVYDTVDDVDKIKDKQKRMSYTLGGLGLAGTVTWPFIWESIKKYFGI